MKLMNAFNFELPAIFQKIAPGSNPPAAAPKETRHVADALAHPSLAFHDPASLHFPNHGKPVVPGAGGYVTMGLGSIQYDHQASWDRGAVNQAGPVREFFRGLLYDNRVKHL